MTHNTVNSVFSINGSTDGHILAGCGPEVTSDLLKHYPLVYRGRVSRVKLLGFMINGQFSPFKPELYAKRGPLFRQG